VIVNEEDPVKARLVNDRINSLLTQANLVIARQISHEGGKFVGLVVHGGQFTVLGQAIQILGLGNTARILHAVRGSLPAGPLRDSLDEVLRFTALTKSNLGTAATLLTRLSQPIAVDKQVVSASTPPLEVFAIAVAATFTLAFVTVLLVAGSLALEREENAFPRLTRGLVSPSALLTEKVALGVAVGLIVTLLMLAGLAIFVPLHWSRIGLWLLAIVVAGAALGTAGAALGAAAREVRAVSLLAFMVILPVAFLSLIPSGTVGPALYDVIKVIAALFPFKPALQAMTAALDPGGSGFGVALLHLGALLIAYGLLARLALRRFSAA
jgi:ABC-2 type transport system permease protein